MFANRTAYFKALILVLLCCSGCGSAVSADQGTLDGATFEVGFSPNHGSLELVVKTIHEAKKQILVAAYAFSSKPVAQALLEASQRGVEVKVVADEKQNGRSYSAVTFLANQHIAVRLNGNYAIHHNKFMVIDGDTVETGSFNYSAAAASKNAENVLVIRNAAPLAQVYAQEWQRLWDEATPLAARY
ncbi:MAG TPA: phospholipase D family protein [Moraxellaceae bacterium]|nr:phospholipase D family protein [Moraxellaceae bacterium]